MAGMFGLDNESLCSEGSEFDDGSMYGSPHNFLGAWDFGDGCPYEEDIITPQFRKAHAIPRIVPPSVREFLRGPHSFCRPRFEPEPEIVGAAGRGDLARVQELIHQAETTATSDMDDVDSDSEGSQGDAGEEAESGSGWEDSRKVKGMQKQRLRRKSSPNLLWQEALVEVPFDSCQTWQEYLNVVRKLEGPNPYWDALRQSKTQEQLQTIAQMEWQLQEVAFEDDFEQVVLGFVMEGVERADMDLSIRRMEQAAGIKVGPFVLDRLQRAADMKLEHFDPLELCVRLKEHSDRQSAKEAKKRARELLVASMSPAELEGRAAACERRVNTRKRRRVAEVVNAAKRWLETEVKCSGFEKSWEWFGDTALIAAARRGHWEIVYCLLRDGLADPTLESCPRDDLYETALGPRQSNLTWVQPMPRSGGPTRQRIIERLLRTALSFWPSSTSPKSAHYTPERFKRFGRDEPGDIVAFRAALDSASIMLEERLEIEREEQEAAEAAKAKAAAAMEAARVAAMERQCRGCGQTSGLGCAHNCCKRCCPGHCPHPNHSCGHKRRRLEMGLMVSSGVA
mmetsp:Transcript_45787/g.83934  ORF Transcript_45787/g.83934 Transcript_45787/m.83934 type:complete len:567 (+) Transcript_45787:49-1749(+)